MKVAIFLKEKHFDKMYKIKEHIGKIHFISDTIGTIICDIRPEVFNVIKELPFVESIGKIEKEVECTADCYSYDKEIKRHGDYALSP
jgi:hypothetical protein